MMPPPLTTTVVVSAVLHLLSDQYEAGFRNRSPSPHSDSLKYPPSSTELFFLCSIHAVSEPPSEKNSCNRSTHISHLSPPADNASLGYYFDSLNKLDHWSPAS
ncbi:unnamed protein product [Microthlaspi erraticum]|uniref:Uncharacterized protein n=1 Tax=Microthlaspi erraticum TaxID=1685480 RepID=A0A6D2JHM2_9BRAS|nr:unnamed protein product [Microthlaspi erraticum]